MRFRLGLIIGFGAGYYMGAKAGRQRYEQIQRWVSSAKDSDMLETATEKAKAVADLGKERARDLIDRARQSGDEIADEVAENIASEVPVRQGNGFTAPTSTPSPGSGSSQDI
jgi:hypothetical protein